jgi:hypothetical protein
MSLLGPLSMPLAYSGGRYSMVPTSCWLLGCGCEWAYPKSHNLTVPYIVWVIH